VSDYNDSARWGATCMLVVSALWLADAPKNYALYVRKKKPVSRETIFVTPRKRSSRERDA